jgi:hypothetical protein
VGYIIVPASNKKSLAALKNLRTSVKHYPFVKDLHPHLPAPASLSPQPQRKREISIFPKPISLQSKMSAVSCGCSFISSKLSSPQEKAGRI